jgi:predicted double-glycine peptidase
MGEQMKEITNSNFSYNDYITICKDNNNEQIIGNEFEFEKQKRALVKEQEIIKVKNFSQKSQNEMNEFLNNLISTSDEELNKTTKIFHHLNAIFNNISILEFKKYLSENVA